MKSPQGSVIGDSNTVYQLYLTGISSLPTNYDTRIGNFLADYLDSPGQPVPFGGRGAEMDRLSEWLNNPRATPYLLLAAPAGRGKSALLVRWSRSMLERPDLRVAFVPVSIRYSTNLSTVLFASLAARLAQIYGEPVPTDANTPADVWQGIVSDYLSRTPDEGRSLLVIVDGIDEAADWRAGPDLFPATPPQGLRVVVSARYTATAPDAASWLAHLGWERPHLATAVDLQPLSTEGVADVLTRMDGPIRLLGSNPELAGTLHHLSGGDPLLVHLFVKDLRGQGESVAHLRLEDLKDIPSGLGGYFGRWWHEQKKLWGSDAPLKEADVQMLLNLLSCAMGPLSEPDLKELEPRFNSYTLEAALKPIERFVAGDGKRQGYVFSHSRLADYFREQRLSPQERKEVYRQYLDWGDRTLAELRKRERTPEAVSPYLVQYYLAHLKSANSTPESLLALVSDEWRRSWETYEGTYSGFLNDVIVVRRLLETSDASHAAADGAAPYIGGEVRCALVQASINSLAGNIPPRLIEALVVADVWTPPQGIAYALQIADKARAAAGLVALLPHVASGQRGEYLGRALALLRSIPSEHDKSSAYENVLPQIAEQGYVDEARAAADDIPYIDTRLRVLALIGKFIDKPLREEIFTPLINYLWLMCDEALVRHDQEEVRWAAPLLAAIASNLSGELAEAATRRSLELAVENFYTGELIEKAAPYLPERLLRKALAKARGVWRMEERAQALAAIAPRLQSPLREEANFEAFAATVAASKILSFGPLPLYENFVAIAPDLPAELAPDLLRAVAQVKNEYWRAVILAGVAPMLPEKSRPAALPLVARMKYNLSRGIALAGLAPHLDGLLKEETLREMLGAARATTDEYFFVECLKTVRDALTDDAWGEALEATASFGDEPQSEAVAILVSSLAARDRYDEAWVITEGLRSPLSRARALLALLEVRPAASAEHDAPARALAAASEIADEALRQSTLAGLAPHLTEPLLRDALDMVCAFEDEIIRSRSLLEIAPRLTESLHEQAVGCARGIEYDYLRALTLAGLTPHVGKGRGEALVEEALKLADAIEGEEDAGRFLRLRVAEAAAGAGLLEQAEALARQLEDYSAHIYAAMAPRVGEGKLREMFDLLRTLEYTHDHAELFIALVKRLPESLLPEARRATSELSFGIDGGRVTAAFIDRLIELELFEFAVEEIEKLSDPWYVLWPLKTLAPHLSEPLQHRALNAVLRYRDPRLISNLLGELAPHLGEEFLLKLLDVVSEFDDEGYARLLTRAALLPHLPEPAKEGVVRSVGAALQSVPASWVRGRVLGEIAPHLPEPERSQAFREILEGIIATEEVSTNDSYGYWPLTSLAPDLPEEMLDEAISLIQSQKKGWTDRALAALAVRQAELGRTEEALATASLVGRQQERVEAITAIARRLPGDRTKELLGGTLEEARGVGDTFEQIRASVKLLRHLPEGARREAREHLYAISISIKDAVVKAKALVWLAPELQESLRGEALEQALAAAVMVEEEEWGKRSALLADVVRAMAEGGLYERALAVLPDITYGSNRANALENLAAHLPQPLLERALEAARGGQPDTDEWRAEPLAAIAMRYEEPERGELFTEALEAAEKMSYVINVVSGVFTKIAPHLSDELLHKAFEMARRKRTSGHLKGLLLARLAPYLPEHLLREALAIMQSFTKLEDQKNSFDSFIVRLAALGHVEEAVTLTENLSNHTYEFANSLAGLAPFLQGQPLEKALHMAGGIPDDWQKETALEGLAPYIPEHLHDDLLGYVRQLKSSRKVKGLAASIPHLKGDRQSEVVHEFLRETRYELENSYGSDYIDQSIARVAPYLPDTLLPTAFELALLRKVDAEADFNALARRLAQIPIPRRYELWREVLHLLAIQSRDKLLNGVKHFGPILTAFGGPEAVAQVTKAMAEVGQWWP
ncbi:MAG TPA: hypothetical protein VF297_20285 [Pyrinomonadaceae bacterium]